MFLFISANFPPSIPSWFARDIVLCDASDVRFGQQMQIVLGNCSGLSPAGFCIPTPKPSTIMQRWRNGVLYRGGEPIVPPTIYNWHLFRYPVLHFERQCLKTLDNCLSYYKTLLYILKISALCRSIIPKACYGRV